MTCNIYPVSADCTCMPPLKNLKHEQFVQAFPKSPDGTTAYKNTYHPNSHASAKVGASVLMERPEVKNRLLEVFEEQGLDEDYISAKLKSLTNANRENVQLGAVRTILEVRKDIETSSKLAMQVNIDTEKREAILKLISSFAASNMQKSQAPINKKAKNAAKSAV